MGSVESSSQWSSRLTFLLAGVGAAVGLGNIWRFPYITGANGGGAFVLVYLLCALAIAIPILTAELLIGRRGGGDPTQAMGNVAAEAQASRRWRLAGAAGIITSFLILSFYTVIAGWTLHYGVITAAGAFTATTQAGAAATFAALLANPGLLLFWHSVFAGLTALIVARGLKGGIERALTIVMPALFGILMILFLYTAFTGEMAAAARYMFTPDFSKLSGTAVLTAMGQAFFSVSLAMGVMMTYGAYLPGHISVPRSAVVIAVSDMLVAIIAGLIIFSLVFQYGLEPGEGTGLVFVTLPMAFGSMPMGAFVGSVFFVLLALAALSSSIASLEPVVAWLLAHSRLSRPAAAAVGALSAWLAGLLTVLSFNVLADVRPFAFLPLLKDKTFFDVIDFTASNVLIPAGALLISLMAGWVMPKKAIAADYGKDRLLPFGVWYLLIRFVAPLGVAFIFVHGIS